MEDQKPTSPVYHAWYTEPAISELRNSNEAPDDVQVSLIKTSIDQASSWLNLTNDRIRATRGFIHEQTLLLSCIRRLPSELWVLIFRFYANTDCIFDADTPPSSSPWILGQVCRLWRQIALSLPLLWNHLPEVVVKEESFHQRDKYEELLRRSGSTLLRLHVTFQVGFPNDPLLPVLLPILDPLIQNSYRWEDFTISGLTVYETQRHFRGIQDRLSSLRSVRFDFRAADRPSPRNYLPGGFSLFSSAPHLIKVTLHSPSPPAFKSKLTFPWAQIKMFKETGVDLGIFPVILQSSPNVESLICDGSNIRSFFPERIYHANLRHLHIQVTQSLFTLLDRLEQITVPALESLAFISLVPDRHGTSIIPAVTGLIQRSSCSLKKLTVHDPQATQEELMNMLRITHYVDELDIGPFVECPSLLEALTFTENKLTLLPRLRSLVLNYHRTKKFRDAEHISGLVSSRDRVVHGGNSVGRVDEVLKSVCIKTPESNPTLLQSALFGLECLRGPYYTTMVAMLSRFMVVNGELDFTLRFQSALSFISRAHSTLDEEQTLSCLADRIFALASTAHIALWRIPAAKEIFVGEIQEHAVLKYLLESRISRQRWVLVEGKKISYIHPEHDMKSFQPLEVALGIGEQIWLERMGSCHADS